MPSHADTSKGNDEKADVKGGHEPTEEQDTIAADMTKYDSPMADLDKRRRDKADVAAEEEDEIDDTTSSAGKAK